MELTSLGFTPGSHDPIRTARALRVPEAPTLEKVEP